MLNLMQINNLTKAYNQQIILNEANFSIREKQKIAVIGRNGAGKSTLFKIIIGQEQADSGEVRLDSQTRIGYLKQEDDFQENDTVLDYLLRESGKEEWECAKIASQFELKNEKLDALIDSLSGGYQMRVKLTLMLLKQPNLILLDEPTNYLDLSTMLLLEKFLNAYNGAYLIISHDRRFIRNTCNEILEVERGKLFHFPNTLEHYFDYKEEKIATIEKFNKKQETKKKHLQSFVDRFGAKASKATQAKSKMKQIDRIQTIEQEEKLSSVRIKVKDIKVTSGFAWRLKDLVVGYPKKIVAQDIELDIERGSHIAVLGDNGQGKSTFLKTLAEVLPPLSGNYKRLENLKVAYYSQHVSKELNPQYTVEQHLKNSADYNYTDEDIYKMAGNFLFRDDDLKKTIAVLSGGEKARLCLAGILLNQYDVLLLDEPTNHLDFETAEILAQSLAETHILILFISHDRTFINILADRIIEVKDGQIKYFSGNFAEYVESLNNNLDKAKSKSSKAVDSDKDKEHKRFLYEEEKKVKRELDKIEKKLNKLKGEYDLIMKKIAKNPAKPDLDLLKELAEVEKQIKQAEEDWIITGENI